MINREDWNGKNYEEMAAAMHTDLIVYKEQVSNFTTVEECQEEERQLMVRMDEAQEKLRDVRYDLPTEVDYDGKLVTRDEVADKIISFIDKLEVKYENTLGLYQLTNIWASKPDNIQYHVYDSTLRCLNQVTFKGYNEWEGILMVNEYLAKCHNEYSLDTGMLVYLSECHNCLVNKMDELNKPAETVNE